MGSLEVLADGRPLELGGHKQRAMLAVLVLEANRVVSSDHLIEALWEDEAPDTAMKALQVYVSQLRKLFGKERLQTRAPGYLLKVEPDELDLGRFQRLQEDGRMREALALWRGPPLAEFEHQRFARVTLASGQTMTVDLNLVGRHPLTDGFDPHAGVAPAGPLLAPRPCTITSV